tara:strand:- start:1871 stop:2197 length:327 start_codon:yes stop_codon:yes gene_type:complete
MNTACTYLPWEGYEILVRRVAKRRYEARLSVKEGWTVKPLKGREEAATAMLECVGAGRTEERALEKLTEALWQVLEDHDLAPVTNDPVYTLTLDPAATATTGTIEFRL